MATDQNRALQNAHQNAAAIQAPQARPNPTSPPKIADRPLPLQQALLERDYTWDAREHVKAALYQAFVAWDAEKTPDTYAALQHAREQAKQADSVFDRAAGRLLDATLHES